METISIDIPTSFFIDAILAICERAQKKNLECAVAIHLDRRRISIDVKPFETV